MDQLCTSLLLVSESPDRVIEVIEVYDPAGITQEPSSAWTGVRPYSECKTWIDAWEYCFSQDARLVQLTEVEVDAAVERLLLYAKTPSWLDV
ncbi:unnamed protein product [Merluccius merluccius]